jgi:prepilin-type N-terminal cleavage/methylation domain-containing protein
VLDRLRVKRDDDGFTLVETMVALVVISIVFAALAGFLVTSIKAQASNERRVRATQVGNQAVEDLRALPWEVLGFYATDAGYAATVNGSETVTLDPPASGVRDSRAPLPGLQEVTANGVKYKRTLDILWYDDAGDGIGAADNDADVHDAKLVRARLSWQVGTATKTLNVEGLRAPTADEVTPRGLGVVSPFQVQQFNATPATMALTSTGRTTAPIVFRLKTTIAASQVRLSYVDRGNITQSFIMTAPSSNTDWTYTLPAGAGPFDVGTMSFTARAYAPAGATADGTVTVTFSLSSTTLDISTPNVSPSSVDLSASGRNTQPITVTATATTNVTSMTVSYPTKNGTVTAMMNLSNSNTTGTYTLPANAGEFNGGSVQWTVTASGNGTASRSTTVTYVPPSITQVAIDALGISPSLCVHNGNGILNRQSLVYITVSGLNTTDKVKLEFTDSLATKVDATYLTTNSSGSRIFRATLPSGSMKWRTGGSPTVIATATRYPDLTQTQRTFAVSLTFTNGATSCPA